MLTKFVHDFVHEEAVRDEFEQDPIGVLDRYGVDPEERQLLINGDRDHVKGHVLHELHTTLVHLDHVQPHPMIWEATVLDITGVHPNAAPAGGESCTLEITGDHFPHKMVGAVFFFAGATNYRGRILAVDHPGEPGSRMSVSVQFPTGSQGVYTVKVSDRLTGQDATWPGFQVT